MNTADRLIHSCGVLSHLMRENGPHRTGQGTNDNSRVIIKLQEINSVLELIVKDFGDFSEVSQIKNMTAEIYEELVKVNLAREKERLDAVKRMLKRDLGVPLVGILQEVFAIVIEQAREK